MSNNKDQALEKQLLDPKRLSDEELAKQKRALLSEEARRQRESVAKSREKVVIKDFYDSKVEPFAMGAIYNVYNAVNHTEFPMNGPQIEGYFTNDVIYNNFKNKITGPATKIDNKEIMFLQYEIN